MIKACEVGNKLLLRARSLKEDVQSDDVDEELLTKRTKLKDLVHDAMTWLRQGLAELEPFEVETSATVDWKQLKVRFTAWSKSVSTNQDSS